MNTREEQNGSISFANDVVATIAGIATVEVEGVAGMSGGFSGGLAELLGRKESDPRVSRSKSARKNARSISILSWSTAVKSL